MLIRLPETWSGTAVAALAMVVLAVLDLGGSLAAKEAVERRSTWFAVLGAALFLLLFWVYASSLQYAELGAVTLGWIVVLQVGVLMVDRLRYGAHLPTAKWLAVGVIIAAQAYLLLGPAAAADTAELQASQELGTGPLASRLGGSS
jgi:hypothetical protein